MSLPNDVCRCTGMRCDMRKQCARFVGMPDWIGTPLETRMASFVAHLCQPPEFEFFIPAEETAE